MPDGSIKIHPALVISKEDLQLDEDGLLYALLISSKNYIPEYTVEIKSDWLSRPMDKQSYFVTHILGMYNVDDVVQRKNCFLRQEAFNMVIDKMIDVIID